MRYAWGGVLSQSTLETPALQGFLSEQKCRDDFLPRGAIALWMRAPSPRRPARGKVPATDTKLLDGGRVLFSSASSPSPQKFPEIFFRNFARDVGEHLLAARGRLRDGAAALAGLAGRFDDEGFRVLCQRTLLSRISVGPVRRLRVELLVQLLPPRDVDCYLGRCELGADEV